MSSGKNQQLYTLLQIRQTETKDALLKLQQIQQQFVQLRQRHEQLFQYRKEYEQQISQIGQEGCRLAQMRNRLEFIHQLDSAMGQAGKQIAELAKERREAERLVQEKRIAEESLKKLLEREAEYQQYQENCREQKENDELGQKQWYSKPNRSK